MLILKGCASTVRRFDSPITLSLSLTLTLTGNLWTIESSDYQAALKTDEAKKALLWCPLISTETKKLESSHYMLLT